MEECVPCERIVFADYMENINETTRPYCEVNDFNEFMCRTQCYVEKMTQCEEYACMMTPEICEYIARICRVLRQPKGHCLVLGPRGCGRRLYSRMASYIMGCNVQEITMGENYPHTEWRTQLKNIIFRAIETNNRCCVILPDCHLTECMICDLMCMMKVENIQHYLTTDDEEYLTSCCRVECNRRNMPLVKENLIKICQERLMNNVHFIMCMNPEEPEFQNYVRKFPHLLCETTINWICQWPQESMMTMARNVLPTCEKTVNVKTDYVTEACMRIHHCFETERVNFTPSEYIPACYENCYFEFLNMFKTLCTKEVERYTEERTRLQNCLTKLNECMKAMSQCRREMRTCPSSTEVTCKVEHMEKMMDKM
jgi:dynein heavy chain